MPSALGPLPGRAAVKISKVCVHPDRELGDLESTEFDLNASTGNFFLGVEFAVG